MSHLGFCDSFSYQWKKRTNIKDTDTLGGLGVLTSLCLSFSVASLSCAVVAVTQNSFFDMNVDVLASAEAGFFYGFLGLVVSLGSENLIDDYVTKKKINRVKSMKMKHVIQAGLYALPVVLGLSKGLPLASDKQLEKNVIESSNTVSSYHKLKLKIV